MEALVVNLSDGTDAPRAIVAQWQDVGNPGRHDTGNGARAGQRIVDERILLLRSCDAEAWVDPQCSRSLRLKSQIHIEDSQKAADQQSRAHQQDAGEGKLGDYQSVADPG